MPSKPKSLHLAPISERVERCSGRMTSVDEEVAGQDQSSKESTEGLERQPSDHRLGPKRTHPLLRTWAVSALIMFCFCAAWSLVTPIGANNDERAQLIKAVSVARGELVGRSLSKAEAAHLPILDTKYLQYCTKNSSSKANCDQAVTVVTVPQSFANFTNPLCLYVYIYPGCSAQLTGSDRPTTATTYVGRYPPLYYAMVGSPSLVWHTTEAVYLMRLLSGVITALLLGLAFALAAVWSRSRFLVIAVAVTATPMVFIFGSAINPSALEAAAAVCTWTGGLILVLDRPGRPPPSLIAATTVAASLMVLSRSLSPLWLAVIAVSLAALAPRSLPVLIRQRSVQMAVAALGVVTVAAVAFIVWAHSLDVFPVGLPVPARLSQWGVVEQALGRMGSLVEEFIGTFSSSETNPPVAVVGLWLCAASAVLVTGLVTSLRRHGAVILVLILGAVVIPTALMVSQAHKDGLVWQARDGFPLYAGILFVAGAVVGRNLSVTGDNPKVRQAMRTIRTRLTLLLAVIVAVVQLGDFTWALRRYAVGLGPTVNPFAHPDGAWDPPGSAIGLFTVVAIVAIVYCWWIARLTGHGTVPALRISAGRDRRQQVPVGLAGAEQ